jgi:hypothetical protein
MNAQARISSIWGISLAALALALIGSPAAAQQASSPICEDDDTGAMLRARNPGYAVQICPDPSPFRLFAIGDFAGSNMKLAEPLVTAFTTNTGLSDSGKELQGNTRPFWTRGTARAPGSWISQNFELQFFASAARGDWLRNKELAPSLENVTGGGWTSIMNTQRLGYRHQWQAHDGSVGLYHSGLQAEEGAGCRDQGGYYGYPYGFPLLAGSDCPETWGSEQLTWGAYTPPEGGFQGRGWIGPVDNWIKYYEDVSAASGPEAFTFDFWKVPQEYYSAKTAVGDFQVYGVQSDHGADAIGWYGAATPLGQGDPEIEGYPLGLDIAFNAYSFKVPAVGRGFIYEGLIINNSEELYGVPLDYDSLYFGQLIRPLRNGPSNLGRSANPHAIPELGAIVHNEVGRTDDCDGAIPVPQSHNCARFTGRNTRGFEAGAQGHLFLKTPLGDLRNKHFTDPNSPFYYPAHPLAGDTITFNRMSICSYRCTQENMTQARRMFGIMSAKPRDALDGRDPKNDLSPFQRWEMFHDFYNPDGTERFCDLNDERGPGCFGYRVPGDWSYSNRPPGTAGGPDTLWIDNCNQETNECTGLWADTLPDRTINWTQNVIWPAAGPFPLAAGDTTAWVTATFAGSDSLSLMQALENFSNFYYNDFYLGPGLPSAPQITGVNTTPGSARLGEASVTLLLDETAEDWVDPFALKVLANLRDPPPGTIWDQIVRADPEAADRFEAQLLETNVDSVYLYKSCDRGRSFTSDTGDWECEPSPAYNTAGDRIGTGWEAWSIFAPTDGQFPSSFVDTDVSAGIRYLYSLTAHTPGVDLVTQYWADTDGDGVEDAILDTTLAIVPEGTSIFSVNAGDPTVVDVYVPASMQAGSELGLAALIDQAGPVPWTEDEDQVAIIISQQATDSGVYNLAFGSDALVTVYRTDADVVDSTYVVLEQSARAILPDSTIEDVVYGTLEFRSYAPSGILTSTTDGAVVTNTPDNGGLITTIELNAKSGVLTDSEGAPIFVSSRLEWERFTPGELGRHPLSPEFVVQVEDDPGSYVRDFWAIDDPEDDDDYGWTIREDLRDRGNPSVAWLQGSSSATGMQYGPYVIDFEAETFGQPLPVVNVFDREETQDAFYDLVLRRQDVSTTSVDPAVWEVVQRDLDPAEGDTLIQVRVPFSVRNLAYGAQGEGSEVLVVMLASSKRDSILLGNAPDTITAPVPDAFWVAGEPLVFLEQVEFAATNPDGSVQLDGSGLPVTVSRLMVTWDEAVVGCDDPRPTCNPVSGPRLAAIPGFVEVRPNNSPGYPNGWDLNAVYMNPFTSESRFEFAKYPGYTGSAITRVTQTQLDSVLVVPNPYIGRSAYEVEGAVRRLMFTKLPPSGTIQIFTASGQFIQRLTWLPEDLAGNGDLFWDMETREGNLIASGLYVFVVETNSPDTGEYLKKLGKFIVIR